MEGVPLNKVALEALEVIEPAQRLYQQTLITQLQLALAVEVGLPAQRIPAFKVIVHQLLAALVHQYLHLRELFLLEVVTVDRR